MKRKIVHLVFVLAFVLAMTSVVTALPNYDPISQTACQVEIEGMEAFAAKSVAGMESSIQVSADAKKIIRGAASVSFSNLIITRPLTDDSELLLWNNSAISGINTKKEVLINVIDYTGNPILTYRVHDALPCRYAIKAVDGGIMIEELELVVGSAEFEQNAGD